MNHSNWFEEQRLAWIDETLHVFGFINVCHVQRKFSISRPQASLDLRKFAQLHPESVTYNGSTKRYEAPIPAKGK